MLLLRDLPLLYLHITWVPRYPNWNCQDSRICVWGCLPVPAAQVYGMEYVYFSSFPFSKSLYSSYTAKLGICYSVFMTVNSGAVLTTGVLLLCYVTSTPTYNRVRPSLFVSNIALSIHHVDFRYRRFSSREYLVACTLEHPRSSPPLSSTISSTTTTPFRGSLPIQPLQQFM